MKEEGMTKVEATTALAKVWENQIVLADEYAGERETLERGVALYGQRLQALDLSLDGAEGTAAEVSIRVKKAIEKARSMRKTEEAPYANALDRLAARWAPIQAALGDLLALARETTSRALLARQGREREARQKAEEALQEARRQEKAVTEGGSSPQEKKEALDGLRDARRAVDELPPEGAPLGVRTALGTVSENRTWTWEVEDFSKVPLQYLTVDRGMVTKAVKGGAREIPGIRIFEVTGLRQSS